MRRNRSCFVRIRTKTPALLTVNPSGASLARYEHRGLGHRQPAVFTGSPVLVGGVAVNDGLTIPDVAVRVGGAVTVSVRQQDVIVHRDSTRRHNVQQVWILIEHVMTITGYATRSQRSRQRQLRQFINYNKRTLVSVHKHSENIGFIGYCWSVR